MILAIRSKDLEVCAKKSNDLYFKTERVHIKGTATNLRITK